MLTQITCDFSRIVWYLWIMAVIKIFFSYLAVSIMDY